VLLTWVLTSQPLLVLPSQSPKPAEHDGPHVPRVQVHVVLLADGRALPQRPQSLTSLRTSTQDMPQRI
jgi:hypothetical protein